MRSKGVTGYFTGSTQITDTKFVGVFRGQKGESLERARVHMALT